MARVPLGLEQSGISYLKVAPGFRLPFGHKHKNQEEVYVLVSGGARMKIEDEVRELKQWDAVRVHKDTMRTYRSRRRRRRVPDRRSSQHGPRRCRDGSGLVGRLTAN